MGLLALVSLVLVRFYFARGGVSWAGDGSLHLTYAALAARTIAAGEFPVWTYAFASGSPFLQFYGFLFYYLVGLVDVALGDLNLTLKILLAAGHVGSGLAMYAFLRAALGSRPAAFIGGLAFVLTFWHTQHVLVMGRLPLSLFYGLLPLPFWAFERARLPGRRVSSVITGALSLAAMIFTHPGYAAWAPIGNEIPAIIATKAKPQTNPKREIVLFFSFSPFIGLNLQQPAFIDPRLHPRADYPRRTYLA